MTICSYLVYPNPGALMPLVATLNGIPGCEAFPAQEGEMAVLVTEAANEDANLRLQKELEGVPSLGGLAMVFGQSTLQV